MSSKRLKIEAFSSNKRDSRNLDVTAFSKLVTNLFHGRETEKSSSSKLLYESFTKQYPTILVEKLLQVYRISSVAPAVRSFSLTLLESLLIYLEDSRIDLITESLPDIKTHLNSCLFEQDISDNDFELLSRIVALVSYYFFVENFSWDELSSYMILLNMNKRALLIFSELPMVVDEEFLKPLLENDLRGRIVKELFNPDSDEVWFLALQAGFSLMIQLVNKQKEHLISDLVSSPVESVWEMVNVRGRDIVVHEGFARIARKVRKEVMRFREAEYQVVSSLALKLNNINGIGEATKMAAKMIHEVLVKYYMDGDNCVLYSFDEFSMI